MRQGKLNRFILPFLLLILVTSSPVHSQWVWMHGSSAPGSWGSPGIQGVPSPLNTPGQRVSAAHWTDSQGKLWMYGGHTPVNNAPFKLEDLWTFDPLTNIWTWMDGSLNGNVAPDYGVMTVPAATNTPGGRMESVTWCDASDNLWLYGGLSVGVGGGWGDLWKYDVSTQMWTWMSGSNQTNTAVSYGPLGVFSPLSQPGSRKDCGHSVDANGNFLLFGGINIWMGACNDVWMYSPTLNLWAWLGGGLTPTSYGVKGVSSPTNWPARRNVFCNLETSGNEMWIWGGFYNGNYADLWRYDVTTTEWTWMSGTNVLAAMFSLGCADSAITSGQCIPDTSNMPGYHIGDMGFGAADKCGNLWVMGGDGACGLNHFNDLWTYERTTREWTHVSGSLVAGYTPNHGTITVPATSNMPGQRVRAMMWCSNGLWLFGGSDTANGVVRNDMWVFAPQPVAAFTHNISACNFVQFTDQSLSQCAGDIHEWHWDFGDGNISTQQNPSHTYASAGTYTVTLIATNCVDVSDTVTSVINAPAALMVVSAQVTPTTCDTTNGSIAVVVNGVGPFTYAWTPSVSTSAQANGLAAGNYSVLVTDQSTGCFLTQSFTIVTANSLVANAAVTPVICTTPGSASIAATGGSGVYTYAWSPNVSTDSTAAGLATGAYSIIVSDSAGCIDTVAFTVLQTVNTSLAANLSSTPALCAGSSDGSVTAAPSGSTGAYSVVWQPGNYTTPIVNNLPAGSYVITVTDTFGCVIVDSIVINQPSPLMGTITLPTGSTMCNTDSVYVILNALGGTAPYIMNFQPVNYTIAASFSTLYVQPLVTTTYTLIITDQNGCVDSATQLITVEPLPIPFYEPVYPGCVPLTQTFYDLSFSAGSPINSWYWEFGDGGTSTTISPTYTYTQPGTYNVTLTVTTSAGCSASDTAFGAVIVYPLPVADFTSSETSILPGSWITFTDQSSGAVSWLWNFGDGAQSTQQDTSHLFGYPPSGDGFYVQLIVENSYGCTDTTDTFITVLFDQPVYAPNTFTPNGDGLNDLFFLAGEGFEVESLLIFDRWGNLIYDGQNQTWDGTYKGSPVQEDVYVWKAVVNFPQGNPKYLIGHITVLR